MIKRTLQLAAIVVATGGLVAWMAAHRGPADAAERNNPSVRVDRSSRDALLTAARTTVFDLRYGVGDRQRLTVGECPGNCRLGPMVEIQAAKGAHEFSEADLASGRFVGRMINHDEESYPRLNLSERDTTYVWVERVQGKWRALYVPTSPNASLVEKTMRLESHTQEPWKQASARWVLQGGQEGPWFVCVELGCCKFD